MKNFLAVATISALLAPSLFGQQAVENAVNQANTQAITTAQVAAKPFALADGTPVKLRTAQPISSSNEFHDYVGEKISFDVVEDVTVNGIVVIAKGTKALGTINEHEGKKWAGRGGKLDVTLNYVRLADGERDDLAATTGGKGNGHTGAMIGAMAATAIFTLGGSALFLMMHGKDITIPSGTELTAYTVGDMTLDQSKFTPAAAAPAKTATAAAAPAPAPAPAPGTIDPNTGTIRQ
jgi:hypothetical protein